jgi:hypothetical protein
MTMKRYLGLVGVVMLVAAGTYVTANKMQKPVGSGFVVHQVLRSGGKEVRQIIRSHKPNGDWREISIDAKTGARATMFGTKELGVVKSDDEKGENVFIGGWGKPLTAEQIRSDPNFVDESEILGYRVLRVHIESPTDGSKTDLYRAPELQGMILKVVSQHSDGSEFSIDPQRIEITKPEFTPPGYPTTRDAYNLRHPKKR